MKDGASLAYYSDNKKKKVISKPIKYSVERLLFDEPFDVREVFAEEHEDFEVLTKIETHVYKKTSKSGRENKYIYKEGKL